MDWQKKLLGELKTLYEIMCESKRHQFFPEHWLDHNVRVEKLALWLVKQDELESKLDSETLIATALLHDVGYLWADGSGHIQHSIKLAEKILPQVGFPKHKIKKVLECILYHDTVPGRPGWKNDLPIECKIVGDADAIESSGCLGILRFTSWSGRNGVPLWIPKGKDVKTSIFPEIGIINNIEIRLPELINRCFSPTARKLIEERWIDMKKFIEGFKREIQFVENLQGGDL